MIAPTQVLDLGADRTRMKDRNEVERQNTTVRTLLTRLYDEASPEFMEIQLLADEVGMGKTFVALAVAFSVLEAQREHGALPGCYRKVLVLVPQNDELKRKWNREVGEIVKRCVPTEHRRTAEIYFKPRVCERPDEIVAALRRGTESVVIAKTSALGAQVKDQDLKIRLCLAALFRHFGRALPIENRALLLKGAADWTRDPERLADFTPEDDERLPFRHDRIQDAIRQAAAAELRDDAEKVLELCKDYGVPYRRDREQGMDEIRKRCLAFYKKAIWTMLGQRLPLVIVDEAHQWKNKRNDFPAFSRYIAPRALRGLLLTATPFQLHPGEILSILEVGDHLRVPDARREHLRDVRIRDIGPALERARQESAALTEKWSRLGKRLDPIALRDTWEAPVFRAAREELLALARATGKLEEHAVDAVVQRARPDAPPELRDFACQALRLFAFNGDLAAELGRLVVRHRRSARHRVVRAGNEVEQHVEQLKRRPDAHVFHGAPGLDVHGDDELPLYLLMRATSELEGGKRTANLGSSLTGCYSTFFESAASKAFSRASQSAAASTYVKMLSELVGDKAHDANHPKMRGTVREVVERWERGEKSLIFAFRVNTAERLRDLIAKAIQERLERRKLEAFGGESGLERLRQRLSTKTEALYQPVLDRVLWSMLWAPPGGGRAPIESTSLRPTTSDYREVARLALAYEQDVLEKPDRVFLHRAAECALARRLRDAAPRTSVFRAVLERMAGDSWVEHPYGGVTTEDEAVDDELSDERGVHSTYEKRHSPRDFDVATLAETLLERDRRAHATGQVGIVRQAFTGPSFWLGTDPEHELLCREHHPADVEIDRSDQRFLHVHLNELTFPKEREEPDFRARALAFKAMRRAILRPSLLARLLPKYQERDGEDWAKLLVQRFTEPLEGRRESMLRLVGVFIEDLAGASGAIDDPTSARGAFYDATKGKEPVGLVIGSTDTTTRARRFQGFNTPLLPEILVCGQIAQEGIDLHRHCSHVIHYDLAWNPATLEQRTGRIDRIGSRTQRLRQLPATASTADGRLEIDTPYLAGTYDERMFEEIRIRAQTFEVLLGGDLAGSSAEAAVRDATNDLVHEDEGDERAAGLVPLPDELIASLRVDLAVWKGGTAGSSG